MPSQPASHTSFNFLLDNQETQIEIRFNGSATFNVYMDGTEVDVFTVYGIDSFQEAQQAAIDHVAEIQEEMDAQTY